MGLPRVTPPSAKPIAAIATIGGPIVGMDRTAKKRMSAVRLRPCENISRRRSVERRAIAGVENRNQFMQARAGDLREIINESYVFAK